MSFLSFNPSIRTALSVLQHTNDRLATVSRQASTGLSYSSSREASARWAISKVVETDIKTTATQRQSLDLRRVETALQASSAKGVLALIDQQRETLLKAQSGEGDLIRHQSEFDALSTQIASLMTAAPFQDALNVHVTNVNASITPLTTATRIDSPDDDLLIEGTAEWEYDNGPTEELGALIQDGIPGDEIAHPSVDITTSVALGGWFRFDDLARGSHQRALVLLDEVSGTSFSLNQFSNTGTLSFGVNIDGGGTQTLGLGNGIEEGVWAHWIGTVDSTGRSELYKNGVLVRSRSVRALNPATTGSFLLNHPTLGNSRNLVGGVSNPFVISDEVIDGNVAMELFQNAATPGYGAFENELTGFDETYAEQLIADVNSGIVDIDDPVTQAFITTVDLKDPYSADLNTIDWISQLSGKITLAPDEFANSLALLDTFGEAINTLTTFIGRDQRLIEISANDFNQRESVLDQSLSLLVDSDLTVVASDLVTLQANLEYIQFAIGSAMTRWENILQLFRS